MMYSSRIKTYWSKKYKCKLVKIQSFILSSLDLCQAWICFKFNITAALVVYIRVMIAYIFAKHFFLRSILNLKCFYKVSLHLRKLTRELIALVMLANGRSWLTSLVCLLLVHLTSDAAWPLLASTLVYDHYVHGSVQPETISSYYTEVFLNIQGFSLKLCLDLIKTWVSGKWRRPYTWLQRTSSCQSALTHGQEFKLELMT